MTEREQFEAHWCRDVPAMFRVSALAEIKASRNEERYRRDEIQWAWEAWQAARATPTDHSDDAKPSTEQNWAKLDGAVAFHLIERHAEDWADAGLMMDAWRKAKADHIIDADKKVDLGSIRALIAAHAELLEQNPYAYFEIAYTRYTGWMAWLCSNSRDDDPNRKILAKGQGDSPEAACADALKPISDEVKP